MFPYYGAKSKIAQHYPPPEYPLTIEPFAGAARYSLHHPNRDVWLNDTYPVITTIWDWLIHEATPELVEAWPVLHTGETVRDYVGQYSAAEILMLRMRAGASLAAPSWKVTQFINNHFQCLKNSTIKYLPLIKHWNITGMDYTALPNIEATWFIDPPYQVGGHKYVKHDIDYAQLAEWCRSRRGQVIVCEHEGAEWLPFQPLHVVNGYRGVRTECVWLNSSVRV